VSTKTSGKSKNELTELQARYAALENEIRLVRDLRAQVASKLKKQVQLHARQSRLFNGTRLRKRAR
jgi:hypothetical protein